MDETTVTTTGLREPSGFIDKNGKKRYKRKEVKQRGLPKQTQLCLFQTATNQDKKSWESKQNPFVSDDNVNEISKNIFCF